jgi:hypothetical protein
VLVPVRYQVCPVGYLVPDCLVSFCTIAHSLAFCNGLINKNYHVFYLSRRWKSHARQVIGRSASKSLQVWHHSASGRSSSWYGWTDAHPCMDIISQFSMFEHVTWHYPIESHAIIIAFVVNYSSSVMLIVVVIQQSAKRYHTRLQHSNLSSTYFLQILNRTKNKCKIANDDNPRPYPRRPLYAKILPDVWDNCTIFQMWLGYKTRFLFLYLSLIPDCGLWFILKMVWSLIAFYSSVPIIFGTCAMRTWGILLVELQPSNCSRIHIRNLTFS